MINAMCSIDSPLEQTIKHMLYLQSITKHADKLNKYANIKSGHKDISMLESTAYERGSSWAVEVGGNMKVFSIVVENLNKNGQMVVEFSGYGNAYTWHFSKRKIMGTCYKMEEVAQNGDKLKDLRAKLILEKSGAIIVTTLDEVVWLYNICGSDVPCCPVVHAYSVVTSSAAFLYVDKRKVTSEVNHQLVENGIEVREYSVVSSDVSLLASNQLKPGAT